MFRLERKLKKSGIKGVIGLDEAGRGALAGPLTVAAVTISDPFSFRYRFTGIRDSKKLSEKKREEICRKLIRCPDLKWEVRFVLWTTVDRLNILEATKLAMRRSVEGIGLKIGFKPEYLLIDGNFKIQSGAEELPVIRGDETIFSCMAAGIIAKVFRDRAMRRYSLEYPRYEFSQNKGYGTLLHKEAIRKYGYCAIHRRTFKFL